MDILTLKYTCTTACTFSLALVSFSLSYIFASLMKTVGANPAGADKVFRLVIITAVFVELIALLITLLSFLVVFVIK